MFKRYEALQRLQRIEKGLGEQIDALPENTVFFFSDLLMHYINTVDLIDRLSMPIPLGVSTPEEEENFPLDPNLE